MHLYNVTINIEASVHDTWLQWMRQVHIPDMLATGKFSKARLCKVMVNEETGGITYSVQYETDSKDTLDKYYKEDAARLRKDGLERFQDKFVAFRTELDVISEH